MTYFDNPQLLNATHQRRQKDRTKQFQSQTILSPHSGHAVGSFTNGPNLQNGKDLYEMTRKGRLIKPP